MGGATGGSDVPFRFMWHMKKKKQLLIFGDSWPCGEELNFDRGENPFGMLLADMHHYECRQYSQPATGIPHLVHQLQRAIKDGDVAGSKAIFCLSSQTRSIYFSRGCWKEIHVRNEDPVSQAYYKYIHSRELDIFKLNLCLTALQHMCEKFGIDDYYVSCWSSLTLYLPGLDTSKFVDGGAVTLAEVIGAVLPKVVDDVTIDRQHPNVYPNISHPNQQGHRVIAGYLSSKIAF